MLTVMPGDGRSLGDKVEIEKRNRIRVNPVPDLWDGSKVCFEAIRRRTIGASRRILERLFDPFGRSHFRFGDVLLVGDDFRRDFEIVVPL